MTLKQRILSRLADFPGATDTELEQYFQVAHQAVNQACRQLEGEGLLTRRPNPEKGGRIGNYLTGAQLPPARESPRRADEGAPLQEEDIKRVLTDWLTAEGWSVETAWGHATGVDIDARRGEQRWMIEVKGPGSRPQMRVNYFVSMLGETLQRMDDPDARYSIALPDMAQFRGLWARLPELAKRRTTIDLLLVDSWGHIENLK